MVGFMARAYYSTAAMKIKAKSPPEPHLGSMSCVTCRHVIQKVADKSIPGHCSLLKCYSP